MNRLLTRAVALAAFAAALSPRAGSASTVTSTLAVSATISAAVAACSVTAGSFSFGTVPAGQAGPTNISMSATCASGVPYVVSLSHGTSFTCNTTRTMTNNGSVLGTPLLYQLYVDSAHTQIFCDGSTGTSTVALTGTGAAQAIPVYGILTTPVTTQATGAYTDTITATVTF